MLHICPKLSTSLLFTLHFSISPPAGEEHLRSLFDTAQSANPGTTKLAEGLR